MRHIIYILLAMLMIGCEKEAQPEVLFGLPGTWTLTKLTFPSGRIEDYPKDGVTLCRIFDEDSTFYECVTQAISSDIVVRSNDKGRFEIKKVGDKLIYLEKGYLRPLQKQSDSVIVIQINGVQYTWLRNLEMSAQRIDKIRNVVTNTADNNNNDVMNYVLSTTERELKTTNHRLIYTLIVIAAILAIVVTLSYRTVQKKRHIEKELLHIREERELRPEPVAKVLRQMEEEFFSSAYYAELREKIERGEFIKPKEWAELEQTIKPVYPDFVHRLLTLYNMSDTELRVCILTKLRFTPKDMGSALCKNASSISSIRNRLYKKIFNENGGSKEWDEFIYSL